MLSTTNLQIAVYGVKQNSLTDPFCDVSDNASVTAVIGGVGVLLVLAAVLAGVIIWKRR